MLIEYSVLQNKYENPKSSLCRVPDRISLIIMALSKIGHIDYIGVVSNTSYIDMFHAHVHIAGMSLHLKIIYCHTETFRNLWNSTASSSIEINIGRKYRSKMSLHAYDIMFEYINVLYYFLFFFLSHYTVFCCVFVSKETHEIVDILQGRVVQYNRYNNNDI